jgi:stringent starvation protein B
VNEQLTSTRPYLLRAMHEWLSDNGQTPLVVVDANISGVSVPDGYVKDGRIVLNIDWSATRNLQMENESISFEARFGGVSHSVVVPLAAVQGIYARGTGQGMLFQSESDAPQEFEPEVTGVGSQVSKGDDPASADGSDDRDEPPPNGPSKGPGLRLVK